MIYDCFMYNNEVELVDLRINLLKHKVDHFVAIELSHTHSGKAKTQVPLQTHPQLDVIQVRVPDYVLGQGSWAIENYHRRQTTEVLDKLFRPDPQDTVLISDADEIPNPYVVDSPVLPRGRLVQRMHYFYLNTQADHTWYAGTVKLPWYELQQTDIQELRMLGHTGHCPLPKIAEGGWHWSSLGPWSMVERKLGSFAHTEFATDEAKQNVRRRREAGLDIHGMPMKVVEIKEPDYPKYLVDHIDDYKEFMYGV